MKLEKATANRSAPAMRRKQVIKRVRPAQREAEHNDKWSKQVKSKSLRSRVIFSCIFFLFIYLEY